MRKKSASSSNRRTYGVGIIGTGSVAGAHIDTFRQIEGCEVRAVASRALERAEAKIEQHGLTHAKPYSSLDTMLSDDAIDIVVVCTPHPNHPAETIAAARAGKHIVIEKPVAMDRPSLKKMLEAVDRAKVQTSVCFELRWIGLFKNIKALVGQGLLGQLFHGEASYFHGIGPWIPQHPWNRLRAMGGDALLTAGCHALDGLIWLMGQEVVEVSAMANVSKKNPLQYEYDPNVLVLLRFADGALGKVGTSIECRQPYLFPVLLQGDKGSIHNDKISTLDWPGIKKGTWAHLPSALPESGDVNDHPYAGQHQYFVDCLRSGKRPHNDLASCGHVHDVMFAIQDALKSGRTTRVRKTPLVSPLFA